MRPASRSASSHGRCSSQATRLWICSRSTRPPKKPSCVLELARAPSRRGRPDLRRDERLAAPRPERAAEHALGAAVHRRRVDETRAPGEGGLDDLIGDSLPVVWEVEHLPRPEADDRDSAPCAEGARLHDCPHRMAPGEPPGRARAGGRADRRAGGGRELPRRLAARAAPGAAAPAGDLRLRPARRQPRRRGRGRPRGAPRRARAGARRPAAGPRSCGGCSATIAGRDLPARAVPRG